MKKSRFTEGQMVAILREADRTSVAEAARTHEVSEQTLYTWRRHFGGLRPADVKRVRVWSPRAFSMPWLSWWFSPDSADRAAFPTHGSRSSRRHAT